MEFFAAALLFENCVVKRVQDGGRVKEFDKTFTIYLSLGKE